MIVPRTDHSRAKTSVAYFGMGQRVTRRRGHERLLAAAADLNHVDAGFHPEFCRLVGALRKHDALPIGRPGWRAIHSSWINADFARPLSIALHDPELFVDIGTPNERDL